MISNTENTGVSLTDLAKKASGGDIEALNELITALPEKSRGIARLIANKYPTDYSNEDDLLQDISIIILEKISQYNGTSKFETWLNHILTNRQLDKFRHALIGRQKEAEAATEWNEPMRAFARNPELAAAIRQFEAALPNLSNFEREIFEFFCENPGLPLTQALPILQAKLLATLTYPMLWRQVFGHFFDFRRHCFRGVGSCLRVGWYFHHLYMKFHGSCLRFFRFCLRAETNLAIAYRFASAQVTL